MSKRQPHCQCHRQHTVTVTMTVYELYEYVCIKAKAKFNIHLNLCTTNVCDGQPIPRPFLSISMFCVAK